MGNINFELLLLLIIILKVKKVLLIQ